MESTGPERSSRRLLEAGADLAGSVGASVAGWLFAGPPGAVGGAAAGSALKYVLDEVSARALSRRERVRSGAAALWAIKAIQEGLDEGEELRTDGFFEDRPEGRSAAKEVVEGVLLTAQREHEERKIRYLGQLIAALAFTEGLDREAANWMLRTAEELSWAQYVLIALIGSTEEKDSLPDRQMHTGISGWRAWAVHEDLADLGFGKRELVLADDSRKTEKYELPFPNLNMGMFRLRRGGQLLHYGLGLDEVPQADRDEIRSLLTARADPEQTE